MEIGDGCTIVVIVAQEVDHAVRAHNQVGAHVVGPVGEAEARIEHVLAPAPLVKAGAHGDGAASGVAVVLGGHVVFFESHQHVMQFIQGSGHSQAQVIQPSLVDHGELGNGEDGEILFPANTGGAHLLSGRQAVDLAVAHGDGSLDFRMRFQNGGQMRHHFGGEIGGQIDEGTGSAVPHQVKVAEADALEGVVGVAAGGVAAQAGADHFAQAVRPGFPFDLDPGLLLQGVEDVFVLIVIGQGRPGGKHLERGFFRGSEGSQRQEHHQGQQKRNELLHGESSFFLLY